jgi:predicted DNA-binding transcriptional regulator AlpA
MHHIAHTMPIMSEAQAAAFCVLGLSTFRRMRRAGKGPTFLRRTDRLIGYFVADLIAWMEKRKVLPGGEA